MPKKILLVTGIIICFLGIFFSLYAKVIFQEGNPLPIFKGIIQLNFSNNKIIKISEKPERYITKSRDGKDEIISFMENRGYEFTEQLGSGYMFISNSGDRAGVVHRQYSRFYSLWNIIQ